MFQKWNRFNEILSYVFDARFGGIQYTSVYVHSANTYTKKQKFIILMYKEWALHDWNNSEKLLWLEFSHEQTLEISISTLYSNVTKQAL